VSALTPPRLVGPHLELRPLEPEDAGPLLETVDQEVWRWKLAPQPHSEAEMRQVIVEHLVGDRRQQMAFLATRVADGLVLGSTTLYEFNSYHQRVEMGWTWLRRSSWGQGYNEEMKYLLLEYCFEKLGLRRVAWRLDSLNGRSRNALERMGFRYEGKLRSHQRRPDGSRRDSLYYSLLGDEWPACREHLLRLIGERSRPQESGRAL
jgi:RimJ/RimL family protein N-acetyltransferase